MEKEKSDCTLEKLKAEVGWNPAKVHCTLNMTFTSLVLHDMFSCSLDCFVCWLEQSSQRPVCNGNLCKEEKRQIK